MAIKSRTLPLFFSILFLAGAFSHAQEPPFKVRMGVVGGYDNNPSLDARRKGDFFAQEFAALHYKNSLSDTVRLRLSSEIHNLNYFEENDENYLIPRAGAGLDFKLLPQTTLEADYSFQYSDFPAEDLGNAYLNTARLGLLQKLVDGLWLRHGFSTSYRDFDSREFRRANGFLSGDEREDDLLSTDTELIWKVKKGLWLKPGFVYAWNDSNDQFRDTYDYESMKFFLVSRVDLCSRVWAKLRFSYENRDYDSRPLVDDVRIFQDDDIYTASAALFYEINKNVSLGVSYAYREKQSNEPSQKYSGAISTAGLYFTF